MSMTIQNQQGEDVSVFAQSVGGYVDVIVRAASKEAFQTAAEGRGILWRDDDGNLHPARGVYLDEMEPVIVSEGDGETPATYDDRYHVNMRYDHPALGVLDETGFPQWKATAILWTTYGTPGTPNADENSLVLQDVELIEPDSVSSPSRIWL